MGFVLAAFTIMIITAHYILYDYPIFKESSKFTFEGTLVDIIKDYDPPNKTGLFPLDAQIKARYKVALFTDKDYRFYISSKTKLSKSNQEKNKKILVKDLAINDRLRIISYSTTSFGGNIYEAIEVMILE